MQALKAWGVQAVVGPSFARIFRRNCVNLGIPIIEAPDAAAAVRQDSTIRIDTDTGDIDVDGQGFRAAPMQPLVERLQDAGGLIAFAAERGGP